MKVALFCLVIFAFVVAQNNHARVSLPQISLTEDLTQETTPVHEEFVGSAAGVIANNQCREYFHTVTPVQSRGHLNSGSYFVVEFSAVTGATVFFTFGLPNEGDTFSIESTTGGAVVGDTGSCSVGSTCRFEFYCDIYPVSNTLEINTRTADGTSAVETATYSVSVRQYADLVPVIQRTFSQSPAVVRPYAAPPTNLGPENWVHYYHDLEATTAELVNQGTLYIRVTVPDAAVTGDGFICVSQSGIVANNEATPGTVNTVNANGQLLTGDQFSTSVTPCPSFCARGNLSPTSRFFYIAFDPARFCDDTDLWIGIRTPSAALYTIDIFFNPTTIPVTQNVAISAASAFSTEGRLSGPDDCDVANGDYSCNAYYVISAATIQANAGSDARFGPIIDVEAFGAINGDFTVYLGTTLQADADLGCAASQSCTFCDGTAPCAGESSCHLVLQPCEVMTNVDYVVTVESIRRGDPTFSADFGIKIGVESSPLTTVNIPDILFGQLTIDHYAHYQVVFTESDIKSDSYFEVQMNPSNPVDDSIAFAWNLNQPAGVDCFTSRGICRTRDTDCGVGYDDFFSNTAKTFCRFLFLACPISELVDQYNSPNSNPSITPNGEKVSELVPGTYYFAVWVPGTSSNYNAPAVEYTLNFNFRHSVPLFENTVLPSSVYYLDYTPQYVITVPSDPTIGTIEIVADNIRNGIVRFYARCGSLAGDCPCWNSDSTCAAQPDYPLNSDVAAGTDVKEHRCIMRVPRCACDSNLIYVSAKGVYPGGQQVVNYQGNVVDNSPNEVFGTDIERPATFTLLALFHKNTEAKEITSVFASRAGTSVTDTLTQNINLFYDLDTGFNTKYYSIKFSGVETLATDALFFTLFATESAFNGDIYDDDFDETNTEASLFLAVGTSIVPDLFGFVGRPDIASGCPFDACRVGINQPDFGYEYNSFIGSCSIVYQPCFNGCSELDRSFNPDTEYFVAVTTPGQFFSVYEQPIAFSLQVQLVDQSPKPMTDGLRFWSGVSQDEYLHFAFDVASSPANSRLVMELYREDQQQTQLFFFVNYFNGIGDPVWAGRNEDCYNHMFCETCVLDGNRQNKCLYDVSPCELSQQTGIYYMSVTTRDDDGYYVYDLYPFYDDNFSPYDGYVYNYQSMQHAGKAFFTLTARYETLTELLPNGLPVPGSGGLYIEESAFYSITVPPTTATIVARILEIEFVSYDTDLFVFLSTDTPSTECTDCIESTEATQNTILRFRRTPCEREAQVYYLTISTPGGDFDDDCDRADYAVNTHIDDVTQTSVSLTTQANTRIPAFFNSATSVPAVPFSVAADEFRVISYSMQNVVAGEFMAVTITMDAPVAGAPSFDVYLAQNQFALPSSPVDDFGFGNNPASSCPAIVGQCFGVNQNNPCIIRVDPCGLPTGSSNWFITLSGEPLAPRTSTANINVLIEKYGSENIINNPAEGVIETTTTNLVLNDPDILFYSYRTTDTLGIAGGEGLRFAITNVNSFSLRIGDETGGACPATCTGLTCTIFACSAISPRTWYFYINGNNGANPVLTIERIAASPSSPNTVTTISPNVLVDRPVAQQNPGTTQAEFEYFRFSLPAATAGRYALTTTGNAANFYFFDGQTATFLPGFSAGANQQVMFGDLSTSNTCGGVNRIPLDSAECCYDPVDTLFAVRNQGAPYTITLETETYLGSTSTFGTSGTVTNTILGPDRVDMISFTVANGNDLIFDISATVGTPQVYLNLGSRAGSAAAGTNPGFCFGNLDILDEICPGNNAPCSGTIPACRLNPDGCTNPATGSSTFTFGVIGLTGDTYTLAANSFSSSTTLTAAGTQTLNFPVTAITVTDTSTSADAFALYSQYEYVYATNPLDLTNYIPVPNDPGLNAQLFPRVVFQFSNFASAAGPLAADPFDIYVSPSPAGTINSGCYSGTEIQNPHPTFLPCLENPGTGAADTTVPGVITCSVNVCALGCGATVYFGFAKDNALAPTSSSFTFTFSATEQYNDLQTSGAVQNLALSVNGGSSSVTRQDLDNNAIVYVRVTQPGVGPGQFPVFTVTPSAATTRTLNVQRVSGGFTCDGVPQAIPNCGTVGPTQTCLFEGDPCTSEFNSIDTSYPVFYRVESTGTGAWGFTFSATVTTIQRIDTAATSLSSVQNSYSAEKEITDFTWHFYSFSVANNDGYSTLSVTVNNVLCEAAGASLEVYANWGSNNALGVFADSDLPSQWPSDSCNLDSATLDAGTASWTSYAMDTCEFNAVGHRVAIFADRNTQLFPNPAVLTGPVPTVYSISASLNSLQRVTLTGCSLTQALDANFVQRIEIPIEAVNRGARLRFDLTKENIASTATLRVSRNSYSYGLTDTCQFDDDDDAGVYSCTANNAASSCEIEVNRCAFFDGTWYAYVTSSVSDGSDITVSYTIDTPYIPVIDSVQNSGDAYTGRLVNDDDDNDNYQFYKITGSSAFYTELTKTSACDDFTGSCEITQTLFTGARGHGYSIPNTDSLADCNDQCDCDCGSGDTCSVNFVGDVCREFVTGCSGNSDYFIGLVTNIFDIACTFSLTVTDIDPASALTLSPSVPECITNPCVNLFEINIPSGQIGEITITGNSGNVVPRTANQIYFSADTDCFSANQLCFSDSTCIFDLTSCEITGLTTTAYVLIIAGDCSTCSSSDSGYSVEVVLSDAQPAVLSIGSPLATTSDFGRITVSSPVIANQDFAVYGPEITGPINPFFSPCFPSCATALLPGSYIVSNPAAGLTLSSLAITSVSGSAVTTTLNGDGQQNFFSWVVPAGVTSFQIFFEAVSFSPFDVTGNDITSLNVEFTGSFDAVPAFGCGNTCANNNDLLTPSCETSFSPRTITACSGSTYYFSLSICRSLSCPVSLSVRVATVSSSTLAPGGTHASAFTPVSVDRQDCLSTPPTLSFYTTVTDILAVSIRQPGSLGPATESVSVSVSSCNGLYGACSINRANDGVASSCSVPASCSTSHCTESGEYQITFSVPTAPYEFEYQIITQYVDLASAISQTIIGDHTHFYRVTDAESALSISLDIASGPGLKFTVLDGCEFDVTTGFVETQFCAFGTCNTWLPTAAKQSSNSGLYITLDSASNTAAIARNSKEINVNFEKTTSYTLSVVRGTANCGSTPTTGFCADPARAGINVWNDVTNNVWLYSDMSSKDSEAECFYNSLLQRCAAPSTECKQFLKTFACVSTFPQCDSNGFQMGVCSDLCQQVEDVCGTFASQGFELLDCASPTYTPGSEGSCANNLPVTQPPVVVDPLSFFNDDDDDLSAVLFSTLDTPSFDTIVATIPAIVNDDDDDKLLINEDVVSNSTSDSSAISFSALFLLFVILLI